MMITIVSVSSVYLFYQHRHDECGGAAAEEGGGERALRCMKRRVGIIHLFNVCVPIDFETLLCKLKGIL